MEHDDERDEARDDPAQDDALWDESDRGEAGREKVERSDAAGQPHPGLEDLRSEPDLSPDGPLEIVSQGFTVIDDAAQLALGRVPGEDPLGDYGTGGGDVGIGGDVSPYGAMNPLDARPDEVEAGRHHDNPEYAKQGDTSERAEDLDISSSDLRQQGEDEAWPDDDDLPSDVPYGDETVYPLQDFDDEDSPTMSIRDEDELDEGVA
jgi:hypothetical protein